MPAALRLKIDNAALRSNWRWLARQSGVAACGAAVKADGYGLGARRVVASLANEGCRDFFVANWDEAAGLGDLPEGSVVSVLHGVRDEDMARAVTHPGRPVLNSVAQVLRWRETRRPCDVMIDTGMNRLGLAPCDVADGLLDGLIVDTMMSHLACADEDLPVNARQLADFAALPRVGRRRSLANSAGVCLGSDYAFDLTRPGLALYGGIPRAEAAGAIAQVAFPEAQVVQRRLVPTGGTVGYGATFVAGGPTEIAILNIGYADGYLRSFAVGGTCGGERWPVVGRVSMDLIAIDVTGGDVGEGDWVDIDYDLPGASAISGLSQYELLTGLGTRFDRS